VSRHGQYNHPASNVKKKRENTEETFTAKNAEICFLTAENAENAENEEFLGGNSSRVALLDPRG
jgi:hypothetical protein